MRDDHDHFLLFWGLPFDLSSFLAEDSLLAGDSFFSLPLPRLDYLDSLREMPFSFSGLETSLVLLRSFLSDLGFFFSQVSMSFLYWAISYWKRSE